MMSLTRREFELVSTALLEALTESGRGKRAGQAFQPRPTGPRRDPSATAPALRPAQPRLH